MSPRSKEKKIQKRVLSALARATSDGEWCSPLWLSEFLGLKQGQVQRALDKMPPFLVTRHRFYHAAIQPGARKRNAGGSLSFSLNSSRMSTVALRDLKAR